MKRLLYSEEVVVYLRGCCVVKRLLYSEETVVFFHCQGKCKQVCSSLLLVIISALSVVLLLPLSTFKLAHPYTQNRCTHAHTIDVPTHNNYFHGY